VAKPLRVRGLSPTMCFRRAASRIILTKYAEMVRFTDAASAGDDADAVHDMRVSCKRLREAVSVLRDAFGRSRVRSLRRDVEALNDSMGAVRESDVFLDWLATQTEGLAGDESALGAAEAARLLTAAQREQELVELNELFGQLLPERLQKDILKLVGGDAAQEVLRDGQG
jgi:CHAD domain-containing protein